MNGPHPLINSNDISIGNYRLDSCSAVYIGPRAEPAEGRRMSWQAAVYNSEKQTIWMQTVHYQIRGKVFEDT